MSNFTHLHLHTEYSLLDGLNRVPKLLEKVKATGMESVAMTDHGVMYGMAEFWTLAQDFGIKPIIGCEIYLSPGDMHLKEEVDGLKYYHLVLLAKNKVGMANLNKIVSLGHLEGMYYKPRVDKETLAKYSEGLICTSACLAGPLSRHIIRNQEKKTIEWLEFFQNTFKDDFYLELQRNGFEQDDLKILETMKLPDEHRQTIREQIIVNQKIRELSEAYNIPLMATSDAHYLNEDDKDVQEILFSIKDGTLISDPKRRLGYLGTYVKTPDEMLKAFSDIPEVLENTMKIAEKVEKFDVRYDRIQPQYIGLKEGENSSDELKRQVYEGYTKKYGELTQEMDERLKYELQIIGDKGYNDYFLVVSDIMKWARSQGIVIGVRGSVAGSVVAYCLDIINVEPVSWELYFERFLNPERPSPPDIDMDLQDDRRDEVIKYVESKYGKENVAAICAIGRMKTKAAIRDVARVMGIDLQIADKLSKKVQVVFGKVKKIKEMMAEDKEFEEIIKSDPALIKLKENVEKIEGMARHISTHACGYLITPEPIMEYIAIQKESKGGDKVITQYEGGWIESLGLMKFDFLGLRNLTIIKNTIDFIKKYHGIDINMNELDLNDRKTFELFSKGDTIGVFQFESPPMQKYLRQLLPETLEDICFMVSAYRPGPMQYIPDYIKRKHGEQETEYLIEEMKPILKNTYGFAIYQEQVIKITVDIAGYSMGQADNLRRAMGKKKVEIMEKEEPKFKEGVMSKGFSKEIADEIWKYLLPFADYGFNKAHGAGYALVAYWCAYLKAHYPIEFMAGLMHSDISDNDRIVIDMRESARMGFKILPPDINKSEDFFTIEDQKNIRFGLCAIKNVSDKAIEEIVKERNANGPFTSLDDLIKRVTTKNLNKKSLECLIKVGAMDQWGSRNQLLSVLPLIWDNIQKQEVSAGNGQVDIFGMFTEESSITSQITPLPNIEAENNQTKISWERELIGTYVSDHPLKNYESIILKGETDSIEILNHKNDGEEVKVLCIINSIKTIRTKKDNKTMAFLELEDFGGKCEGVLFTRSYERLSSKVIEFKPMIIKGKVNFRNDRTTIMVEDILDVEESEKMENIKIDITSEKDAERLTLLKDAIRNNPGDIDLNIIYGSPFNKKMLVKKVSTSAELIRHISKYRVKY